MMFQTDLGAYIGGITLALVATVFFNYAPLLMKTALGKMEEIKGGNLWKSIKTMLTNKRWLIGMVVSIIGGIFYFLALNIAGITIVQPLLNFGFIVLVIAAKRMLGEELDTRAKVAIGLLIVMPVFMTLSKVSEPQNITNYSDVIIFSVVCIVIIAGLGIVSKKVAILWALTTGVTLGISALYMQWFTTAFFNGIESTGDLFVALGVAILPLIITLVGNIVANVVFMQIGLQKNAASRFNPINGSVNMIVSIIGGILLFGQQVGNWVFYCIGIGLGIAGILLLSKYQGDLTRSPILKETAKEPDEKPKSPDVSS
jgi:hypothetical protein